MTPPIQPSCAITIAGAKPAITMSTTSITSVLSCCPVDPTVLVNRLECAPKSIRGPWPPLTGVPSSPAGILRLRTNAASRCQQPRDRR